MSRISRRGAEVRVQPSEAVSRTSLGQHPSQVFGPTPTPFVSLLYSLEALRREPGPYVLQFVASESDEGTTTVASGFAQAAACCAGKSVILIDCNPLIAGTTSGLVELFRSTGGIAGGVRELSQAPKLHVAHLFQSTDVQETCCDVAVREVMQHLKQCYELVLLDCPPATISLALTLMLSRFSEGTVLVVRADRTLRALVVETKEALIRAGGNVVGTVLNRSNSYIPSRLRNAL
jgi:hypothetical protein